MTSSAANSQAAAPLAGVRVVEVGTRIAAPFCAAILAEQGAEVIKVERPGSGDVMREIGPFHGEESLFWAVESRSRKSVTLDLRRPEAIPLFRRLVGAADVVCENFRAGTMERWGLGPADLDPHLIYIRISVFGQNGPYASRPGLDLMGVGYGGLLYVTGPSERPPVKSAVTISDHLTAVFAALAATAALYERDVVGTGLGCVIDASLYGSIVRTLEGLIPEYDRLGIVRGRSGTRRPSHAPSGVFETQDKRWIALSAARDDQFAALNELMRPDPPLPTSWASAESRHRDSDPVHEAVEQWISQHAENDLLDMCLQAGIPASRVQTSADLLIDPHLAARGDLAVLQTETGESLVQPGVYPRFAGNAIEPTTAPRLGEHNELIWCDLLGYSRAELGELRASGVV